MFDLNAKEADGKTTKYLIEGTNAKIKVESGQLAGYELSLIHIYLPTKIPAKCRRKTRK